jgi:hypothetical protein
VQVHRPVDRSRVSRHGLLLKLRQLLSEARTVSVNGVRSTHPEVGPRRTDAAGCMRAANVRMRRRRGDSVSQPMRCVTVTIENVVKCVY